MQCKGDYVLICGLPVVSLCKPVLQTFHVKILNSLFAKSSLSYRLCGFCTYVHDGKSNSVTRSLFVLHKQSLPYRFFLFPTKVDAIPDFTACTSDNERESLKATHARDRKTRADIVIMNLALADIFLANLPKAICETHEPI